MSKPTSDPKLAALEKSLSALVPLPGRIDRDQLLYRAGQASVRPRPWLWRTSTGLLAVVAAILGTALAVQSKPETIERIVYVQVPHPQAKMETESASTSKSATAMVANSFGLDSLEYRIGSADYLKERDLAVRWGVDALPPPQSIDAKIEIPTIESMLGLSKKEADSSGADRLKN
jgi:hypothetical protein